MGERRQIILLERRRDGVSRRQLLGGKCVGDREATHARGVGCLNARDGVLDDETV